MSPLPPSLAVATVPPDESPLTAGRGLLSSTRATLARDFDAQLAAGQSVLDRATYALKSSIDYTVANASGAVQAAQAALDNRVNLMLGNAMLVADAHGIPMPSPTELRTRTNFPPPSVLQSAPGMGPNTPILADPPEGGVLTGGGGVTPECGLLHTLDPGIRELYTDLYQLVDQSFWVMPVGQAIVGSYPKLIFHFASWYAAELACRLLSECNWPLAKVSQYFGIINRVTLIAGNDPPGMGGLCQTAQGAFDSYIKALGQTASSILLPPMTGGNVLPIKFTHGHYGVVGE